MVKHYEMIVTSEKDYDIAFLGARIKEFIVDSGIFAGIVTVITAHTTTGIIVTEPFDCILTDVAVMMRKLAEDDTQYTHAHFLPSYGRTSANAPGHLRSILTGNSCIFPIQNGAMLMGAAQEIVLLDFDGPQERKIYVDIIGE
jgi:secondary thiamine-phosphate synthase enzyme